MDTLRVLDNTYKQAAAASLEELHFNVMTQHYVIQAGKQEATKIRQRWFEFIHWCGKPAQANLLATHRLQQLAEMANMVRAEELRCECDLTPAITARWSDPAVCSQADAEVGAGARSRCCPCSLEAP
jgi:NADH:ubiquinone oxidoreductase subunit